MGGIDNRNSLIELTYIFTGSTAIFLQRCAHFLRLKNPIMNIKSNAPEYFILQKNNQYDEGKGFAEIEDWVKIKGFDDWGRGVKAVMAPNGPVELRVICHDGFQGDPPDFSDFSIPLMSSRLKMALENSGVDNIRFLPVHLRNSENGKIYDYFAFNLVGVLSVVDFNRSDVRSLDGDFIGDSQIYDLSLKPCDVTRPLVFRMAEKYSTILIHVKVKLVIESAGINTVKFTEPKDFFHL
jgi:hypothetical protein